MHQLNQTVDDRVFGAAAFETCDHDLEADLIVRRIVGNVASGAITIWEASFHG